MPPPIWPMPITAMRCAIAQAAPEARVASDPSQVNVNWQPLGRSDPWYTTPQTVVALNGPDKQIGVGQTLLIPPGRGALYSVKDGDTILFGKYSGSDIKLDNEEYMIMREDEVLAVVEK